MPAHAAGGPDEETKTDAAAGGGRVGLDQETRRRRSIQRKRYSPQYTTGRATGFAAGEENAGFQISVAISRGWTPGGGSACTVLWSPRRLPSSRGVLYSDLCVGLSGVVPAGRTRQLSASGSGSAVAPVMPPGQRRRRARITKDRSAAGGQRQIWLTRLGILWTWASPGCIFWMWKVESASRSGHLS